MDKTEYRVLIQNKFAAIQFDDEAGDDPLERINKLKEQEALAKKNAAAVPKPAQVKKPLPVEVALKNEKNEKNIPQKSAAKPIGFRPAANQSNKFAPNRPPRAEVGADGESKTTWNNDGKPREDRPFRGRGGLRRGRGGFRRGPEEVTGKREFDRHSGNERSGVKPHEKREGGGAHNWGSIRDDINEQMGENVAQEASSSQDDLTKTEVAKDVEVAAEPIPEKAPEPEEKQYTLDEWKKMQEQNRLKASFNVRKANEGCQDPKWGKMVVLKKSTDDEEDEDDEQEEEVEKKQANKVDIQIMFNDAARRGGRGRGGMNRRGFNPERRAPRNAAEVPDVADENAFPSLS